MPAARLAQFDANLVRARDLVGLGQSLGAMTHGRVNADDLYRGALVQAVAALDTYVHAVVEDRAVDIVMGRLHSATGVKPGLTPTAVAEILAAPTPGDAELTARKHIAQRLGLDTHQRPDDIASALAAVGVPKIWSRAFPDAGAAKTALGLVVTRRNVIVHQCDADPLIPGAVIPLADVDALDAVATVERTVHAIDAAC